MAFLEDPRLRQRWNQITHDAEAVTENAAAGIWSFQQHYINPCLGSLVDSIEQCTSVCIGDAEERRRRRREQHIQSLAETSFDFYDDWYEEEEQSGGLLGGWGGEDWDRLLAGTGSQRRHHTGGETSEQPRRKRGMSYGTRTGRRKPVVNDPTIIPSSQPIGFLSKLPWKMGGTLRYKPSAANLQEHPGKHENAEAEPLLGSDSSSDMGEVVIPRKRSGTTGSGDTSDSYRSRGDLFPSDGEGEEDAVPLDDDVTYDMIRKDDRSSGRTRSSKGKRPALSGSRTVSRTTIASNGSRGSPILVRTSSGSLPPTPDIENVPSLEDLQEEEEALRRQEDEKLSRQKAAAAQLAAERGLRTDRQEPQSASEPKPDVANDEVYEPEPQTPASMRREEQDPSGQEMPGPRPDQKHSSADGVYAGDDEFVGARLPRFG